MPGTAKKIQHDAELLELLELIVAYVRNVTGSPFGSIEQKLHEVADYCNLKLDHERIETRRKQ